MELGTRLLVNLRSHRILIRPICTFETSATTNDFYVDDVQVVGAESQTVYADYSGYASLKGPVRRLFSDWHLHPVCFTAFGGL